MRDDKHRGNGVFRPYEVAQMRRELKRGDRPGETTTEREQRAIAIIHSHGDAKPARAGTARAERPTH
jgi:hypothetical protein